MVHLGAARVEVAVTLDTPSAPALEGNTLIMWRNGETRTFHIRQKAPSYHRNIEKAAINHLL